MLAVILALTRFGQHGDGDGRSGAIYHVLIVRSLIWTRTPLRLLLRAVATGTATVSEVMVALAGEAGGCREGLQWQLQLRADAVMEGISVTGMDGETLTSGAMSGSGGGHGYGRSFGDRVSQTPFNLFRTPAPFWGQFTWN